MDALLFPATMAGLVANENCKGLHAISRSRWIAGSPCLVSERVDWRVEWAPVGAATYRFNRSERRRSRVPGSILSSRYSFRAGILRVPSTSPFRWGTASPPPEMGRRPVGKIVGPNTTRAKSACRNSTPDTGHRPPARNIGRPADSRARSPQYWGSADPRDPLILTSIGV